MIYYQLTVVFPFLFLKTMVFPFSASFLPALPIGSNLDMGFKKLKTSVFAGIANRGFRLSTRRSMSYWRPLPGSVQYS